MCYFLKVGVPIVVTGKEREEKKIGKRRVLNELAIIVFLTTQHRSNIKILDQETGIFYAFFLLGFYDFPHGCFGRLFYLDSIPIRID